MHFIISIITTTMKAEVYWPRKAITLYRLRKLAGYLYIFLNFVYTHTHTHTHTHITLTHISVCVCV